MKKLIEKIKKKFNSLTNEELEEVTTLLYDSSFEAQHILDDRIISESFGNIIGKYICHTDKVSFRKTYMLVKKINLDKRYVYFNGPGFYYELMNEDFSERDFLNYDSDYTFWIDKKYETEKFKIDILTPEEFKGIIDKLKRDIFERSFKENYGESYENSWNDSKEIPSENNKEILIYNKYKKVYIEKLPVCLRSCKLTKDRWKEFVEEKEILYWIYLDNLLPK